MDTGLRAAIATEAARLLLRGKESNYAAARIRASRWLSRRRVSRDEMPGRAEIEERLYVLAGLESAEHHAARLREARLAALSLGERLADLAPRFAGPVVLGPLLPYSELVLVIRGDVEPIGDHLSSLSGVERVVRHEDELRCRWQGHPAVLLVDREDDTRYRAEDTVDLDGLRDLVGETGWVEAETIDPEAAYDLFHVLLARLDGVRLDTEHHPEGDALYHTLQVFELGRDARPWDEEFLLACLLHDVGLAIEPRHRTAAAVEALAGLVTDRTLELIEQLPRTAEALRTGDVPRSLRRSEAFDDLWLLAQCDRDGRRPGAETCTLEEALAYTAGLDSAWDDV